MKKVLVATNADVECETIVAYYYYNEDSQSSGTRTIYAPKAYYDPSLDDFGGFGPVENPQLYFADYDSASIKTVCLNKATEIFGDAFSEESMEPYVEYILWEYDTFSE